MSGDGMEYLWLTDGRAKKLLKDIEQLAPELLNKIKADAVREGVNTLVRPHASGGYIRADDALKYANKLEKGNE